MTELLQSLPWFINLLQFGVMAWILLRVVKVLDDALARAQTPVAPAKASPPVTAPQAPKVPAPPEPAPQATPDVVVDQGLVDFVKKQEGFAAKAYWDYKQYSIGYGTKAISATEVIDQAEGERRLAQEIGKAAALVESFAPSAPKGVKQALTDLTYNAGSGWEHAELGTLIKAGNYVEAKTHILAYNHAGGQVNAGLTARRESEIKWFDNPL